VARPKIIVYYRFNTILASQSFTQLRAVFEEYSKVNYSMYHVCACVHLYALSRLVVLGPLWNFKFCGLTSYKLLVLPLENLLP